MLDYLAIKCGGWVLGVGYWLNLFNKFIVVLTVVLSFTLCTSFPIPQLKSWDRVKYTQHKVVFGIETDFKPRWQALTPYCKACR